MRLLVVSMVMVVMISVRVDGLMGRFHGIFRNDTLRKRGGLVGLMLSNLWMLDVRLARLRDIRIGKEHYLLFVL